MNERILGAWMSKAGREHYDASGPASGGNRSNNMCNTAIQYANQEVVVGLCPEMGALRLEFCKYKHTGAHSSSAV